MMSLIPPIALIECLTTVMAKRHENDYALEDVPQEVGGVLQNRTKP